LALALDPFAQQLVQTEPRSTNTTAWTPTIARTDRYAKGFDRGPSGPKLPFADADLSMKVAVINGMIHTLQEVGNLTSFNCPTGNCTWEPFESLAVCSSCNSLENQLTRYINLTQLINILDIYETFAIWTYGTTLRTNNDLIINNADNLTYVPLTGKVPESGIVYMTAYGTGNPSATASFQDNDLLIWPTTIFRLQAKAGPENRWPDLPTEAIECALYYCVKRYKSTVYNGVLSEDESIVDNVRRSPGSWQIQPNRYSGAPGHTHFENSSEVSSLEYSNQTAGFYWTDLVLETDSVASYNVSQQGVRGISAYFQTTLREEVDLGQDATPISGVLNGWALYFGGSAQYSPTIMQTLWESANISATFDALGRSMSNAIRAAEYSADGANSSTAQVGTAQVTVVWYSIKWGWIVLHAVLVLVGLVFLAITIRETASMRVPAWKSHSLPALAFPDQVDNLLSDAGSVAVMEQRAAKYQVRFAARGCDTAPMTEATGLVQRTPS